jgi:predicted transcriptional regulator
MRVMSGFLDIVRRAVREDNRSLRELARVTGIDVGQLHRFAHSDGGLREQGLTSLARVLRLRVVQDAPKTRTRRRK